MFCALLLHLAVKVHKIPTQHKHKNRTAWVQEHDQLIPFLEKLGRHFPNLLSFTLDLKLSSDMLHYLIEHPEK